MRQAENPGRCSGDINTIGKSTLMPQGCFDNNKGSNYLLLEFPGGLMVKDPAQSLPSLRSDIWPQNFCMLWVQTKKKKKKKKIQKNSYFLLHHGFM